MQFRNTTTNHIAKGGINPKAPLTNKLWVALNKSAMGLDSAYAKSGAASVVYALQYMSERRRSYDACYTSPLIIP